MHRHASKQTEQFSHGNAGCTAHSCFCFGGVARMMAHNRGGVHLWLEGAFGASLFGHADEPDIGESITGHMHQAIQNLIHSLLPHAPVHLPLQNDGRSISILCCAMVGSSSNGCYLAQGNWWKAVTSSAPHPSATQEPKLQQVLIVRIGQPSHRICVARVVFPREPVEPDWQECLPT